MALAVFFLLVGLLCAEIAMIGLDWASLVGAGFLLACALTLLTLRSVYESQRARMSARRAPAEPAPPAAPPVREPKGASSSVSVLRST